jgi:hypothetical protein
VVAPFNPSSLSPVTTGFTPTVGSGYHPYDAGSAAAASSPGANYETARELLMQSSRPAQPPPLDPFSQNFPKRNF